MRDSEARPHSPAEEVETHALLIPSQLTGGNYESARWGWIKRGGGALSQSQVNRKTMNIHINNTHNIWN